MSGERAGGSGGLRYRRSAGVGTSLSLCGSSGGDSGQRSSVRCGDMLRIERARKSSACTTGNVAVKLENERAADRSIRSDAVKLDLKPNDC